MVSAIDLTLTLERSPAAAGMARGALLPLRRRLGDEHFSDLRVVVSELVANATTHGAGEDIRLSLTVEETGVVRGRVEDDGPLDEVEPRLDSEAVDEGLGLLIVDTLASTWGVDETHHAVWFEIDPPLSAVAVTPRRQIADELVNLHLNLHGQAARAASVLLAEDAVVALLEGVSETPAAGPDAETVEAGFRAAVERILGRRVTDFSSFVSHDSDDVCHVFRLAPLRGWLDGVGDSP